MTSKQLPLTASFWPRRLPVVALFVLLVILLSGCTGRTKEPRPKLNESMAHLPQAPNATMQPKADPGSPFQDPSSQSTEKASSLPAKVRLEKTEDKLVAVIPVSEKTHIAPSYQHKTLGLTLTPPLQSLELPEPKSKGVITDITSQSDSKGIHSLDFHLDREIQFLVTRPRADMAEIHFVPVAQAASTESTSRDQPSLHLEDIDFHALETGDLLVQLTATHPFDYRLRPGDNKELRLLFPQMHVPHRLIKLYRLSQFQSAVRSALLTNTSSGAMLTLSGIDKPIPAHRQGRKLILTVPGESSPGVQDGADHTTSSEASAAPVRAENGGEGDVSRQIQLFPGMKEEYTGKPISLNLQDADVEHVLRLLAEVGEYSLILDQSVSGTISLKLNHVPWDQVLDLVLQQKDLGMVKRGNILRIAPADELEKEQERIINSRKAALEARKAAHEARQSEQEMAPLRTAYIQINYAKAAELQPNLEKFLSERGEIGHDSKTNQIIISDTEQAIDRIRGVVRKLDRAERQVLIEARLVYATDEFQRSLGLKWGGSYSYESEDTAFELGGTQENDFAINLPNQGSTTLGLGTFFAKLSGNSLYILDAQLELGEIQNQARTISSPRVVTLNNQQAEITQGTKIAFRTETEEGVFTTEFESAQLKLAVTPQITPDNNLILDLDITDDSPVAGGEDIETRSIQTKLFVDNDQTLVIGGIQQLQQSNVQDSVPVVSQIPLLGWFFKNKSRRETKRELLIFIRPHILDS
ncbi:MAG: type IV pilus secretin PilQ [Desulfovermiculus sp.]|nr:type IV pilus secretin PilQ [Desulfovermiculus sp.]